LHSAAIHLLRRLRAEDAAVGLTGPQLSALSVIVFRGPLSLGALAAAEQVRPPTISRLIRELERQQLVERAGHEGDARVQHVCATDAGKRLLAEGRARRVALLSAEIAALPAADRTTLRAAAALLEKLSNRLSI
jgi:DNA-binding MarR family transcriptional regulator